MTDQIAKLQLQLCLLDRLCPNYGTHGDIRTGGKCNLCHGTGKVSLLEGEREKTGKETHDEKD